jgi:actin
MLPYLGEIRCFLVNIWGKYRLTKNVLSVAEEGTKVSVVASSDRKYSVWIGASIFSTLSTFPSLIVSKQEYQEEGSAAVHRKCTDRDSFH